MRRLYRSIVLYLAGLWHALCGRHDRGEWEIEVDYRPAIDGADYEPVGTVIKGPAHCVNCGHRGTVWIPHGDVTPDLDVEIVDSLCCPVCGLYTCCSD